MAEQSGYGVTPDGFVLKGIDRIVADQHERARAMFGDDVDLTSGSALRKVLDAAAWGTHELWRGLEAQYYGMFVTTAQGTSLDLLGTDLGLPRRPLPATGDVTVTLGGTASGRRYVFPEGTVLRPVGGPAVSFRTTAPITLIESHLTQTVTVRAVQRGADGNLAAQRSFELDPAWATHYLNLGAATLTGENPLPLTGGDQFEPDEDYRARLLGVPRALWTQDALLAHVLQVDGVRDGAIFDPLGGVDVSQSYFNLFTFGERSFARPRQIGSPYYFDVVVAAEPGWPWQTGTGTVPGLYDSVVEQLRQWRPVSIFANVLQANEVDIGIRATLVVPAGHNHDAVRGQIVAALHASVNAQGLGRGVRYSDVMLMARTAPGVVDVQNLHLRRCPAAFGAVNAGGAVFGDAIELAIGENVVLAPDEVARLAIDSPLIDIEMSPR